MLPTSYCRCLGVASPTRVPRIVQQCPTPSKNRLTQSRRSHTRDQLALAAEGRWCLNAAKLNERGAEVCAGHERRGAWEFLTDSSYFPSFHTRTSSSPPLSVDPSVTRSCARGPSHVSLTRDRTETTQIETLMDSGERAWSVPSSERAQSSISSHARCARSRGAYRCAALQAS